jgi:photosystem II stability/assembly factor-like uncharacterized protein
MKRATLFSCLFLICCVTASAHSPHDDVFDVKCSPTFVQDDRLYALVRSVIQVSNDRGETWKRMVIGLDHRHMLVSLDVAADGRTVFVSSLGDGIYRSSDAGKTWQRANNGLESLVIDVVAASPDKSAQTLVADVEGGLYRTTNAGSSWQKMKGSFAKVTAIAYLSHEHGAVLIGDHRGGLFLSQDGGENWDEVYRVPESGGVSAIAVSPAFNLDPVILVGTTTGRVLRSGDGGASFDSIVLSKAARPIVSIGISPEFQDDRGVFASVWDEGVYVSSDGGEEWDSRNQGLTRDVQAVNLGRPDFSRLAVSPGFADDRTVFLAGFDGLFRSTNGGRTWRQTRTLPMTNIVGLAVSPDYPNDRTLVLTTWLWGAFRSADGGKSWHAINKGFNEPYPRDEGLIRLFNVAFSPSYAEDKTLFTSTWYDFFKSTDRGARWNLMPKIEAPEEVGTNHGSYIAVSPDFRNDKTVFLGTKTGLILRSTDSGESFRLLKSTQNMIGAVVISPSFAVDRTVFVGDTLGIHCSRDAGRSWEFSRLIEAALDFEMPLSPAHPVEAAAAWKEHVLSQREKAYAIKVAISPAYATDQTAFAGTADGLRRSLDGGRSWHRLSGGGLDQHAYIEAVAVSPGFAQDATLVVSVRGRGHFRSHNGGESFSEIATDLTENSVQLSHHVGMIPKFPSIVFSPAFASDQTLYGFSGSDLFRSDDGGTSWRIVPAPFVATSTHIYAWLRYLFDHYHIRSRGKKLVVLSGVIAMLGAGTAYYVRRKQRISKR